MPEARFQTAADVFTGWRDDLLTGKPPTLYPAGAGDLARIDIGPELVILLGGAPGAGKTAFSMQLVIDALRLTPTLRALVCNVEMRPGVLLDRQLARLSGVDLSTIRRRKLGPEHADRIDQAMSTLEPLAERLCFVRAPYDLANIAEAADAFEAGLLVIDYIQRVKPPGDHGDKRGSVDASMDYLRQFADAGVAVVVVSAVGRTRDGKGRSSYDAAGLGLASFKESGELEYGADSAYLLCPDSADGELMTLRCLKDRNGEPKDIDLHFDPKLQRFTPVDAEPGPRPDAGKLRSTLRALWSRTPQAREDDEGDAE